ncbi:MAG: hypothetical protein ABS948_02015 [Solibacillus sp.]
MKRKIVIFSIFICMALILLLLLFPEHAHEGVDLGTSLFMEALFPYLLPYLILTGWFIRLTTTNNTSHPLSLILKIYVISALGGFPTGSATISQLVKQQALTRTQAAYLLGICHSPSPLFLIGFVGQDLLGQTSFSWNYLLLLHSFSLLLLLFLHKKLLTNSTQSAFEKDPYPFSSSVKESVPTVAVVAATIIFFTTVYHVLLHNTALFFTHLPPTGQAFLGGILEMTNGLFLFNGLLSAELFPLIAVILLTAQSFSIHLQVVVLAKSADIPLKVYVFIRLLYCLCIPLLYILFFM